jgi:hypothetical protein
LPAACCLLPAAYCLLPAACCLLPVVNYPSGARHETPWHAWPQIQHVLAASDRPGNPWLITSHAQSSMSVPMSI